MEPLSIAYYCTGHGLGHATRSIEVCKALVAKGHSVIVVTGAPAQLFLQQVPPARFIFRKAVLDSGSKQHDPFTVDMKGSLEEYYNTCVVSRDALLASEVSWLKTNKIDIVVSDVVPLACAAASLASVPAVCVSNFSWDFIYSEYLTSLRKPEFRKLVWQIAEDYAHSELLLRLPGHVPMPAFKNVEDVPLVVRRAQKSADEVRRSLGLTPGTHLAVLITGGHRGSDMQLRADFLPPNWVCIVCAGGGDLGSAPLPSNFKLAPQDAYTPDLINAADCLLGKIGYGTASECLAHGTPLVFVRRDHFNEEPFLRKMLEIYDCGVEIMRRDFFAGHWAAALTRALTMRPSYREPTNGAEVVAVRVEELARAKHYKSLEPGRDLLRLRDTVVWGYLMQTPKTGAVEVPDWYVRDSEPFPRALSRQSSWLDSSLTHWTLVQGSRQQLASTPDMQQFLGMLLELDDPVSDPSSPESSPRPPELPERRAARGLFRWDDEVVVSRAPGRLDVMGGIADYSGSLVLQLPIAEACHCALQRHTLEQQRVWKHMQARHDKLGGPRAAVRVVSFHADETNRAPTFDMDLDDLYPDGKPISYEAAREYFKRDPARSWAAYVVGCLVVLSHEKGMRFSQGLSILISSDVPEGKGVSSSAAVEVSVMSALLGGAMDGRELALLCQKVENLVVGAPCGIMDQMSSCLGESGKLMAMVCQPAEVGDAVPLPQHMRFWGVDSGIRHSVGGADYGSVRVGAFMGLRIVSGVGAAQQAGKVPVPFRGGYLANMSPSELMESFEAALPEAVVGADFLKQYGTHYDGVTTVNPEQRYCVRWPASHPVAENFRVNAFRQALLAEESTAQLETLGELMFQSHASYSRCGLGSDGTNRLVALVREHMAAARAANRLPLMFGAKITGGGSGGTVCILSASSDEGEAAVGQLVEQYAQETGHTPKVFSGSSPGAAAFGVIRLLRKQP